MDITPDMNCATERKMEIMFMAKPVWAKRELNCVLSARHILYSSREKGVQDKEIGRE